MQSRSRRFVMKFVLTFNIDIATLTEKTLIVYCIATVKRTGGARVRQSEKNIAKTQSLVSTLIIYNCNRCVQRWISP